MNQRQKCQKMTLFDNTFVILQNQGKVKKEFIYFIKKCLNKLSSDNILEWKNIDSKRHVYW